MQGAAPTQLPAMLLDVGPRQAAVCLQLPSGANMAPPAQVAALGEACQVARPFRPGKAYLMLRRTTQSPQEGTSHAATGSATDDTADNTAVTVATVVLCTCLLLPGKGLLSSRLFPSEQKVTQAGPEAKCTDYVK